MDSPRGRIHLMDARLDGTVTLNATVTTHFDRCLGCMACVSSCPSGVRYDRLIETTRAAVEQEYERPWSERLLRGLAIGRVPRAKKRIDLTKRFLFGVRGILGQSVLDQRRLRAT